MRKHCEYSYTSKSKLYTVFRETNQESVSESKQMTFAALCLWEKLNVWLETFPQRAASWDDFAPASITHEKK